MRVDSAVMSATNMWPGEWVIISGTPAARATAPECGSGEDRDRDIDLHAFLHVHHTDLERPAGAGLAAGHHAEQRRAPDQHRLRAERAGLEDVDTAAHAAVEQHGHPVPHSS